MGTLKLIRLDKRRLGDFERLLSNKEFKGCYCTRWSSDAQWEERCKNRSHENLEKACARVKRGEHVGFLVSREMDGAMVGWTGSGPKASFPALKSLPGSRLGPFDASTWCIACLAVGFPYRGLGYARQIVDLLIAQARLAGAKSVEAYPVEPSEETQAYRGDKKLYEGLGFEPAGAEKDGDLSVVRMEKKL